jgi:hypothetical protein
MDGRCRSLDVRLTRNHGFRAMQACQPAICLLCRQIFNNGLTGHVAVPVHTDQAGRSSPHHHGAIQKIALLCIFVRISIYWLLFNYLC